MPDIAELFAAGGALDRALPGYRPREGQIEMARQVETMLGTGGHCVLEAGTGIGKTFAYLTPIIQSGKTALISTGARALQDQLSQRDIPLLAQALGRDVSLAVLKGRANYICKAAIRGTADELFQDETDDWQKIIHFAGTSEDGDLRGITDLPANSPLLGRAVSTRESCNARKCEHYDECFLYRARERARTADIVIVNHHLFLSDMRLRDEGVADILPSRDVVLFDEAHLLPQLAPQFFGEQVSGNHLMNFIKQIDRIAAKKKSSEGESRAADALRAAGKRAQGCIGQWLETCNNVIEEGGRQPAAEVLASKEWVQSTALLTEEWRQLSQLLENQARAEGEMKIANYALRAQADVKVLENWLSADGALSMSADGAPNVSADGTPNAEEPLEEGEVATEEEEPTVRWMEHNKSTGNVTLHSTPMTGRSIFARQWEQQPFLLFTSATLSVGGDFNDFCESAGLAAAETHSWDSPYDFANRSLLYLPPNLPPPNDDAHTQAVVEAALPLVRANGGRAFMLFSSWRALNSACDLLREPLETEGIDILKQGDMSNDALLRRFRRERRVVLLGTKSFWQGVDVRGDALSLLVVDKIPFTPPTDPLLKARDEWRKKQGENSFMRNQLPAAVLLMKQVAGRLIRDYDDYGVFMIGDPRVKKKSYGKTVLSALPPMPHCTDGEQAVEFLRRLDSGGDGSGGDGDNAARQ